MSRVLKKFAVERKSFTVRAALLTCALALAGISAAAAAPDHIRVGVGTISATSAIFAATKELGFYAAQNLDVDIQTFRSGAAAQDALAAGSIDLFPAVPAQAARAIATGVKERIVAMYAPPRPAGWYIMVPSASPIQTLAALNGRTVGVTELGTPADAWVQRVAKNAHVAVTTVALGSDVAGGLAAKRVDAALLWPPASYGGLMNGTLRALVDLEAGVPPTVSEGIAASGELIDRRPDALRRWLTATSKGVRYMQDNENWTETFLKNYLGTDDGQAIAMVYQNIIRKIDSGGVMRGDWMKTSLEPATPVSTASAPATTTVFSTAFTARNGR